MSARWPWTVAIGKLLLFFAAVVLGWAVMIGVGIALWSFVSGRI